MNLLRRISLTDRVKIGLLIVAVVVGVITPYVVSSFIVGLFSLALISGIFAMSIDILAGYGGLVTLGQAGISGTAAYGVGYMANRAGAGYGAQLLVGFSAGILVAVVFGVMAMRSSGVYFIMVTLAQGMIVWGLSIRLNTITGAENGLTGIPRPGFIGPYWAYYWFVLAMTLVCSLGMWVAVHSPFGSAVRGIRESESRMRMLGYNVELQKFYVFVVAGFYATVSGVLLVYLNEFVSPAVAQLNTSALGVLQAILGGIGTLVGPMIGAFIIIFIENFVSQYIERWPTLMGLIFIVVVLFARNGLVGALSSWWRRRLRPEQPAPAPDQEPAPALEGS